MMVKKPSYNYYSELFQMLLYYNMQIVRKKSFITYSITYYSLNFIKNY